MEGRNSMPTFRQFRPQELAALAAWVSSAQTDTPSGGTPARRYSI